jgi:hypothetical protein
VVNPGFHKTPLVAGMTQSMRDTYAKLPPHKQQEYGTDFLEVRGKREKGEGER